MNGTMTPTTNGRWEQEAHGRDQHGHGEHAS